MSRLDHMVFGDREPQTLGACLLNGGINQRYFSYQTPQGTHLYIVEGIRRDGSAVYLETLTFLKEEQKKKERVQPKSARLPLVEHFNDRREMGHVERFMAIMNSRGLDEEVDTIHGDDSSKDLSGYETLGLNEEGEGK